MAQISFIIEQTHSNRQKFIGVFQKNQRYHVTFFWKKKVQT